MDGVFYLTPKALGDLRLIDILAPKPAPKAQPAPEPPTSWLERIDNERRTIAAYYQRSTEALKAGK